MREKVMVALPEKDNEFQVLQAADAAAAGARLGLDVEIAYAANNAVQQIQQLFKALNSEERPKAVVVEPVALDGMERVAQKAVAAGIGWSVLNCTVAFIDSLRRQAPTVPVFAVGSDQVEIGRLQGRQMRVLLPNGGTILYIQGPLTATAAQERLKGMQEAIAGGGIKPIMLDAQWSEESAEQAVRQWLRLKTSEGVRVDLVAGQDDSMARGARRAIDVARWGEIPFLGIDGVPEVGQKLVQKGQLTGTVVMPSNTGPALEAIAGWLRTGVLPPASVRVSVRSYPDENELLLRTALKKRAH